MSLAGERDDLSAVAARCATAAPRSSPRARCALGAKPGSLRLAGALRSPRCPGGRRRSRRARSRRARRGPPRAQRRGSVSASPGTLKPLTISPMRIAPNSAPQERADDPAPEAVRQEDREVPDGEAHHRPDEHGHQRGLPCLRLRGFFGFGCSPSPSPSLAGLRRRPARWAGAAVGPRARGRPRARPRGRAGARRLALLLDAEVAHHRVELALRDLRRILRRGDRAAAAARLGRGDVDRRRRPSATA